MRKKIIITREDIWIGDAIWTGDAVVDGAACICGRAPCECGDTTGPYTDIELSIDCGDTEGSINGYDWELED